MLKYEHLLDMDTENSASIILKELVSGSKVLELGPATGYMTRYMTEELGCEVYCIEMDPQAAKIASKYCVKMIVADLEDLSWTLQLEGEKFDYIIFADVLEHLRNPKAVLKQSIHYLNTNGSIITSIPNIAHNSVVMEMLEGKFEYRELGLLDNTHVRFFTKRSIISLLDECGLCPIKWMSTVVGPEETEFRQSYDFFPEHIQNYLIEKHEGHAYQYITVSKIKEHVSESKEIDYTVKNIENRYNFMQIFWRKEGYFSEANSFKEIVYYDNLMHTYNVKITSDFEGYLRIDPGNWRSIVNIKSITLSVIDENGDLSEFQTSTYENRFKDLSFGQNILCLNQSGGLLQLYSQNKDPQLLLKVEKEIKSEYVLVSVEMSLSKDFNVIDEYLTNKIIFSYVQEEQIEQQREQIEQQREQIETQAIELKNLAAQIESLQTNLDETNRHLGDKTEELSILQCQFEDQIELKLEKQSEYFNNRLNELYNSNSWKVTAPLRSLGRLARKCKRGIINTLYLLSFRKFKVELEILQDLEQITTEGNWKSIGIDPAFNLKGTIPTGWISMEWDSNADESIPLQIYWDAGEGMLEQNSAFVGMIPRGTCTSHKIILYLPEDVKKLRLDPGDKEINFQLKNLSLQKISKLHLAFFALKNFINQRGFSVKTLVFLFRKFISIYTNFGIKGVWQKAKSSIGLVGGVGITDEYRLWIDSHQLNEARKQEIINEIHNFKYKPLISIVVPVYNVEEFWLRKCLDSVVNQLYPNWELCIADDASPKAHVRKVLEEYACKDKRIKVVFRKTNGHISESSNSALELATGEFVGLLDHDDELTIDALYENVKLLNQHPDADMIYSDEDKINVDGMRHSPFFKPDWSPDMILTHMYSCHFGVYRLSLVKQIGGFRKGYEGSQDFDLVLRLTELTDKIFHIPKILYHWRTIPESTASGPGAKNYTHFAGLKAIKDTLNRRNINGWVEELEGYSNFYLVHYSLKNEPLISIIIPTRDMHKTLDACLASIFSKTTYSNFEVIVVDNGSKEPETLEVFRKWIQSENKRFRVINLDIPFNYSKLNNFAVKQAKGELILLLNNDIEIISPNWLQDMAGHAMRDSVGAVGAYLMYPDNTVQHSGLTLGLGAQGVAGDAHHHRPIEDPGYFGSLIAVRNYSAVTAACLMIRKELYQLVGGLNEELLVAYNDVDFCIKVREQGYNNVWLSYVKLYHHESKTRGHENTPEKMNRFNQEAKYMRDRWGDLLEKDPYYNPNLSLKQGYGYKI